MKANKAPEKIWINHSDLPKLSGHIDKDSVEYIREDAFIEKAVEWLKEKADMYEAFDPESKSYYTDKDKLVEDFKKYMKGE